MAENEVISWRDLQRGTRKLTAKMWHNPEGDIIPTKGDLKGQPRASKGEVPTYLVRYDKDYIIHWFINNVLEPLMISDEDTFDHVLDFVWNHYEAILANSTIKSNDKE